MTLETLVEKLKCNAGRAVAAAAVASLGLIGAGCSGPSNEAPKEVVKIDYKKTDMAEYLRAPKDFAEEHITLLGKPTDIKTEGYWDSDYKRFGALIDLKLEVSNGEPVHGYLLRDPANGLDTAAYKNLRLIIGKLSDRKEQGANVRVGAAVDGEGNMELKWVDFGEGREYLETETGKEREVSIIRGYCVDIDTIQNNESEKLNILSIKERQDDENPRFWVTFPYKKKIDYESFRGKKIRIEAKETQELKPFLYQGLNIKVEKK